MVETLPNQPPTTDPNRALSFLRAIEVLFVIFHSAVTDVLVDGMCATAPRILAQVFALSLKWMTFLMYSLGSENKEKCFRFVLGTMSHNWVENVMLHLIAFLLTHRSGLGDRPSVRLCPPTPEPPPGNVSGTLYKN